MMLSTSSLFAPSCCCCCLRANSIPVYESSSLSSSLLLLLPLPLSSSSPTAVMLATDLPVSTINDPMAVCCALDGVADTMDALSPSMEDPTLRTCSPFVLPLARNGKVLPKPPLRRLTKSTDAAATTDNVTSTPTNAGTNDPFPSAGTSSSPPSAAAVRMVSLSVLFAMASKSSKRFVGPTGPPADKGMINNGERNPTLPESIISLLPNFPHAVSYTVGLF
mmetsp:Transcript_227/g.446  ORF Transcript_227/g.446 Transcript_227/m.446 type:complete len:221 (-) Transcript_227:2208-2870(-)